MPSEGLKQQTMRKVLARTSPLLTIQAVAQKALGVPVVYVEAVDQDGNRVVEKVESEVKSF